MKRGIPIPQSTIDFIRRRARNRCEAALGGTVAGICETRIAELHHIKARSRGGSNYPINLLAVCRPCHDAIERHRPGTDKFRTWSWQKEGSRESDSKREDS